jgi:hypothetical protein
MVKIVNAAKLDGGILKLPMDVLRVVPCFTKRVFI